MNRSKDLLVRQFFFLKNARYGNKVQDEKGKITFREKGNM